jgi:type IV secretory pathway VirB3-like protein
MTIIKLVFLLIPIIILSILAILLFSVRGILFKKDNKKISNEMITCFSCGISVHESLIFKKNSKIYCSDNCANS